MRRLHPWEQYLKPDSSHFSPARPYYFLRHSCLQVHASVTDPFELSSQCSLVQIVIAKSNNTKCFPRLGTGNTFGRQLHCLKLSPMLVLLRAVAACSDTYCTSPHMQLTLQTDFAPFKPRALKLGYSKSLCEDSEKGKNFHLVGNQDK